MPNKSISMNKIRQVLRCYASGSGTKSISSMLSVSRNTVKKYLHIYQKSGLSLEDILSLDDTSLCSLFQEQEKQPEEMSSRYKELHALFPDYSKRLKKKGVTRNQLFKEYQNTYPDGYARSRFCTYLQAYLALSHPIAHLEHKAGDKMYIDYAGDKLSLIDRETGEIITVEVFVSILPCSQLTYVEAVMSQRKEDLIHACEGALLFYGGTPAAIVPDNLKSAVTKPSRYEAELNEDFAAFAEHYGCVVMPARVRKPRDKALVEGAVKLIYRSIYTKLDGREFYDLESLNAAIRVALELHNNALLTGRNYSRREQYEEIERDCMGPLNPVRFELKQRHTATVQKNGYIRLERHYYSAPYVHIGKKVNVLYNNTVVEIYLKYEKVAVHKRSYKPYGYTYLPEHQASSQRVITEWNPEKFLEEAACIHADVRNYIQHVIEAKPYPEQAYKSCRGILSFASRVGRKRLINACRWASSYGLYNYPAIEEILKNRQDELPLEDDVQGEETGMPTHENIRGKEYYNSLLSGKKIMDKKLGLFFCLGIQPFFFPLQLPHLKGKSMGKNTYFTGQPLYSQLLKLTDRQKIVRISRKGIHERYVKKLDGYSHFVIMLYAVLMRYDSLREIVIGMLSEVNKINHLGLDYMVKRSTLAEANNRRSNEFFEQIYFSLYSKYKNDLADSRIDKAWERLLHIMDSTTITLFSNVLKGAGRNPKHGKKKGGIKVHTVLKAEEGVPYNIHFTSAATHDHIMLAKLKLTSGAFIAMDRAYIDYKTFQEFTDNGVFYVTKMKKNLRCISLDEHFLVNKEGLVVLSDHTIELKKDEVKHVSRRIEYWQENKKCSSVLLTNNFELEPEEIIAIYLRRWQIESLFKQLKQNFPLRYFFGESVNAIKTQIWVTLIANLLLSVIRKRIRHKWSFSNLVTMIRQTLMYYIDLYMFCEDPEKAWLKIINHSNLSPPEPTLFD